MAISRPKPWINFGKMSIFRLFELFVFIAQKSLYSFQNIIKDYFLAYIGYKRKLEKWPFLDQNHGLTPLKKISIFRLFELLVFLPRKAFFVLGYHRKHFPSLYYLKKKSWKNGRFLTKTPLKNCRCFDFLNFLFLQPRTACFCSRIS